LPRSFESNHVLSTGDLEPPGPDEDYIGGHEMVAIGFDRRGLARPEDWWVKVRNSWGPDVGVRGNFRIRLWYWLTMTPSGAVADPGITISKVSL
jgi:C1A family cysteine protease